MLLEARNKKVHNSIRGNWLFQQGQVGLVKFTLEVKGLVEAQMQKDDETSACQLYHLLNEHGQLVAADHSEMYM